MSGNPQRSAPGLLAAFREEKGRRGERRVTGVLQKKAQGFGFLRPLWGGDDLFLPPSELRDLHDGDLVRAEAVRGQRGRSAGRAVELIERRRRHAAGIYRVRGRAAVVEPIGDGLPPSFPVRRHPSARDGQAVRFTIPDRHEAGEVEAVLGDAGTPALAPLEVAYGAGFSEAFPREALAEAAALPGEPGPGDLEGRADLSGLPLVTIDGEDARDFDDAVHVEAAPGGDRLVVAIADVAHYVRPGSALDAEALRRGTSVYLPDRALPMLPERLANGLCSLVPGGTRLCRVADLVIDGAGRTVSAKVYPAVMRSAARCTYAQVAASLAGEAVGLPAPVVERFPRMARLAGRLTAMRRERGAIDFNLPEGRVVLDAEGRPVDVARRPRTVAHRLVEEFMLAANEAVARHFEAAGLPTVWRIHDAPDEEKLADFAALARAHGFDGIGVPEREAAGPGPARTRRRGPAPSIGRRRPSSEAACAVRAVRPQALDAFLRRIAGHPEERALNSLLLRAMMQALYSAENIGHYGLGARTYLHFTSPIRRYPDLVVHRLLAGRQPADPADLAAIAARCSERERAAMAVEREVDAYYGALLMQGHVGATFDGVVDGVVEAGLFVELERFLVSGLVHAADLGAGALFEPERQQWRLPRSGRIFHIGGSLRVTVASVNVARRQIDFEIARGHP